MTPSGTGWPGRFGIVLLLAGAAALPLGGPAAAAEPAVRLDQGSTKIGARVVVRLAGWPVGTVSVELCGNQARRGSVDCAVASASTIAVGASGSAVTEVSVTQPPVACPCVVRARQATGGTVWVAPIAVTGVRARAAARATGAAPTELTVDARLSGPGAGWELLGGPATRTLTLTVRNTGRVLVAEPQLAVTFGRPARQTSGSMLLTTGSLAPGEQRALRVPVTFEAPAWGHYTVRTEVRGVDNAPVSYAHARAYPWLLALLPIAAAAMVVLRPSWRNRGRTPSDPRTAD